MGAFAGILAFSITVLPVTKAVADQVLELPQTTTPAAAAAPDVSTVAPITHYRHNQSALGDSEAPTPANLGSIDDYEHQGEADQSSYRSSSPYASSGGGLGGNYSGATLQFESGDSREALTNNLILGAVVLGLFAMEVESAHHRHHR